MHRIVAQYYCDNPCNLPIVNHKDEDRANNRAENLEWCTTKYNLNYSMQRRKDEVLKALQ
ncbi:HNH endonuclease [Vibrio europaeus]|uniref:HNH endonuclease n=1 Tax=Vibrio europaeus TaxID=300876 RepID=UPI003CE540B3